MADFYATLCDICNRLKALIASSLFTMANYLLAIGQGETQLDVVEGEDGYVVVEQRQVVQANGVDHSVVMAQITALTRDLAIFGVTLPGIEQFVTNLIAENQRLAQAVAEETLKEIKRTCDMLAAFPPIFEQFRIASSMLIAQLHTHPNHSEPEYQEAEKIALSVTHSLLALRKFDIELDVQLSSCSLMDTDMLKNHVHKHLEGCSRVEDSLKTIKKKLPARSNFLDYLNAFEEECRQLGDLHLDIHGANYDDSMHPGNYEQTASSLRIEEIDVEDQTQLV